jgi:hypothetical protein
MRTIYGVVCDQFGVAHKKTLVQGALGPEFRHDVWTTPAAAIRGTQPSTIMVDRDHDHQPVGEVIHLERRHGNLWAVAQVRDDLTPAVRVKVGERSVAVETAHYSVEPIMGAPGIEPGTSRV